MRGFPHSWCHHWRAIVDSRDGRRPYAKTDAMPGRPWASADDPEKTDQTFAIADR